VEARLKEVRRKEGYCEAPEKKKGARGKRSGRSQGGGRTIRVRCRYLGVGGSFTWSQEEVTRNNNKKRGGFIGDPHEEKQKGAKQGLVGEKEGTVRPPSPPFARMMGGHSLQKEGEAKTLS